MKILTAKWRMRKGDLSARAGTVHVDRLFHSIEPKWYPEDFDKIKASIEKDGMEFPIIIWETTNQEWLAWHNGNPDLRGPSLLDNKNPTKKVMLVMCGNNRLAAAKELGYDYIDVIMCFDKGVCSEWCSKQRKWWKERNSKLLKQEKNLTG